MQLLPGLSQLDLEFSNHDIFLSVLEDQVIVREPGKFHFKLPLLLIPGAF